MSSSNHTEHDLAARLSQRAEQFDRLGGSDLDLDRVLDRAGEIKRGRRMRATMVMAACVLAIAVPTALIATNRSHDKGLPPAPPSQVDRSALTIDGLKQGDAPRIAYVQSGALHRDGFTYTSDTERYVGVAELRNGTMLQIRDDAGNVTAHALDGGPAQPMSGDFAMSPDGKVVAFVEPDGTPVVVTSDGVRNARRSYTLPRVQRGSGFDAVAVGGDGCDRRERPCVVWVTSHGSSPESWISTLHGAARRALPTLKTVTAVDETGTLAAGVVEVREDLTTCSAVVDVVGAAQQWATCEHRLLAFSPDGDRVLAAGSIADGIGDTQLAVLDTDSGAVALDLRTADQAFLGQMVWEDDTHVLVTLFQDGRWAVVRIGLDGRREYAVAPIPAEDIDVPFALAAR